MPKEAERPTCQPTILSLPFNLVLTVVKFTVRCDESPRAGRRHMNLQLWRSAQWVQHCAISGTAGFTRTSIWQGPCKLPASVVPPQHPLRSCRDWGSPKPQQWGPATMGAHSYVPVFWASDNVKRLLSSQGHPWPPGFRASPGNLLQLTPRMITKEQQTGYREGWSWKTAVKTLKETNTIA